MPMCIGVAWDPGWRSDGETELAMADASGREGSTIVPKILLVFVLLNFLVLLTELTLNVLGAMLPL
jgi:hypothetical protein